MLRLLRVLALLLPAALASTAARAEPSQASRDLLEQAALLGQYQLLASDVAIERGGAQLQPLANLLLADHAAVGARLAQLAAERGIDLPAKPGPGEEQMLARLREVSASDFDALWLRQQQTVYESALALFAGYASEGDDPALRAFAAEVLPTLNAHLDDIEALLVTQ